MAREKKRIYVDGTKANVQHVQIPLVKGMPCIVKNHVDEEWKIKFYSKHDDTSGSNYQRNRPYKVHNKTNTEQNFSFKYCEPLPQATAVFPVA